MDTNNYAMIPKCGSLPDLRKMQVVVGAKQLRKAMNSGRAQQVFLAENADPAITEPLVDVCRTRKLPVTWVRSMRELGMACGIQVGAAAAAIRK